jgi:hypothetical protein
VNCLADAGCGDPNDDCGETDEGVKAVRRSNLRLNGGEKEVLCRQLLEVLELSTRSVFAYCLYISTVVALFLLGSMPIMS